MSLEIQEGLGYEDALAIARLAEDSRVSALLLGEHYLSAANPGVLSPAADAWVFLGGLSRETRRLRIGTLVSPVTFRHPSVHAKMAATLQEMSDGRAELGLGAGWLAAEHERYGFAFPDGPARVSMVQEQLMIVRGLWSSETFSFEGDHYSVRSCSFTPRLDRYPRILVGGGGPRSTRLMSLAMRFADEYVMTRGGVEDCRSAKNFLAARDSHHRRGVQGVRLGLFARLALLDSGRATPYAGKKAPDESEDRWIVGSAPAAADRVRVLSAAGVDCLYLSVESLDHARDVCRLADFL